MSFPVTQFKRVPGTGAWYLDDFLLLQALGVLHRRKRYSKIFYINPDSSIGSDACSVGAQGTRFDTPLLTLAAAISYCTTANGDFIVLQPSTTQITEEDVSIAIADLTLVGMEDPWCGYGLKPDAAVSAALLSLTAAADNVLLKRLYLDNATGLKSIIKTASGAHFLRAEDCLFNVKGASGSEGYGIDTTAAAVNNPVLKNCVFTLNTYVTAAIALKAGAGGGLLENCTIINMLNGAGTPPVDGINLMAGTGVVIKGCHINGGDTTTYIMADGIDIDAGVLNTLITGPCYIGNCTAGVTDGGSDTCGATAGEGWFDISHS